MLLRRRCAPTGYLVGYQAIPLEQCTAPLSEGMGGISVRPSVSLVRIIAPVRIGVAVVSVPRPIVARVTVTRSVVSVSRPVVARPNCGGRSRSAHDAKADSGSGVNTATVIATAIIADIGHVRESCLLEGCHA